MEESEEKIIIVEDGWIVMEIGMGDIIDMEELGLGKG